MQLVLRGGALLVCALLLRPVAVFAQETQKVDIHGYYFKETSTRVVQPRVEVSADLPATKTYVSAFYLLDAITSASIAAGAGRDIPLTEHRNEVGLGVTQTIDRCRIGDSDPCRVSLFYQRSRESDYNSDTVGGAISIDLFEKNTTWSLGYAHTFDTIFDRGRRTQALGGDLDINFFTLSVAQILGPKTVIMGGFELALLEGFQQNPYRGVPVGGMVTGELLPTDRRRFTYYGRLAHLFDSTDTTLQLIYRIYHDNWDLTANTIETRLYQGFGRFFDARMSYRYHAQDNASFARTMYDSSTNAPIFQGRPVFSGDPKLLGFDAHYLEFQVRVALYGLENVPVLKWIKDGTVDFTLGFLYAGTTYGNCGPLDPGSTCQNRILALGMTVPF